MIEWKWWETRLALTRSVGLREDNISPRISVGNSGRVAMVLVSYRVMKGRW